MALSSYRPSTVLHSRRSIVSLHHLYISDVAPIVTPWPRPGMVCHLLGCLHEGIHWTPEKTLPNHLKVPYLDRCASEDSETLGHHTLADWSFSTAFSLPGDSNFSNWSAWLGRGTTTAPSTASSMRRAISSGSLRSASRVPWDKFECGTAERLRRTKRQDAETPQKTKDFWNCGTARIDVSPHFHASTRYREARRLRRASARRFHSAATPALRDLAEASNL